LERVRQLGTSLKEGEHTRIPTLENDPEVVLQDCTDALYKGELASAWSGMYKTQVES
jgi:hypothetical protein